jgi:hypothetical protein
VVLERKDSPWEENCHLGRREGEANITWAPKGRKKKRTGTCGELEGGGDRRSIGIDLNALTDEDLIQIIYIKARDTAFKKGIALGELMLEMFGVATEGEGLTMPVFLLAGGAGGCASGASGMLRVAL